MNFVVHSNAKFAWQNLTESDSHIYHTRYHMISPKWLHGDTIATQTDQEKRHTNCKTDKSGTTRTARTARITRATRITKTTSTFLSGGPVIGLEIVSSHWISVKCLLFTEYPEWFFLKISVKILLCALLSVHVLLRCRKPHVTLPMSSEESSKRSKSSNSRSWHVAQKLDIYRHAGQMRSDQIQLQF